MIRTRRALLVALLLGLAVTGALYAQAQGRLQGTVVDQNGAPLAGVKVTAFVPNSSYKVERTTDKNGKFAILVVDAARSYRLKFEKEGLPAIEQPFRFNVGDTRIEQFVLTVNQPTEEQLAEAKRIEGQNKAVTAYNEGVGLVQAKNLDAAVAKFQEAVQIDPSLAEAYGVLADIHLKQGRWAEALAAAEKFAELKPAAAKGLRELRYDAYKGMGDEAKANAALEDLIKNEPGREAAIRVYNLGAEATRKEQTEVAIRQLRRAMEIDPTLTDAYVNLANLYLAKKQNKEALEVADSLLKQDPNNGQVQGLRYAALTALGDKAGAKQAFDAMEAGTANQTPQESFRQGVALYNANNIPEAMKAFERTLAKDPNFAKAHYLLGLALASSGQNAKAKEHIESFLKLAPNDPDAKEAQEMLGYLK
ncbi:MAG TPA: tetratricopeptide repeat protein [Thermoanaerobaculia bacterium]|nr:tetratricopeptide repeat protein [Thermoanaerobaculia bacterium]